MLAFQHPLTREVAYGTQLGDRREETHAAAARAIVELEPERHDELAALIAQHMESGGESPGGGPLVGPGRPLDRQQPAGRGDAALAGDEPATRTSCRRTRRSRPCG